MNSGSQTGLLLKTAFNQINELVGVQFGNSIKMEVNPIEFIRSLVLIEIKQWVILCDQLEDNKPNREQIGLINVIDRGIGHLCDVIKFLRRENKLINHISL